MHSVDSTPELVEGSYRKTEQNLEVVRSRLGRPLTLAEKILYGHLSDPAGQDLSSADSYLFLYPDRVAMSDSSGPMALLQFMLAGRKEVASPTTVHCDHLIQARQGAGRDLETASVENHETYAFLRSAAQKYGIGFWGPGSGIIHQVLFERYAFPGGLLLGVDSHTPNAGGLGMLGVGTGGADSVDVMAGFPWELKRPSVIGVRLSGELRGWTAPKDVILLLCSILTTRGGTNRVIEYFGPGAERISCTGKATITNMGAELGATSSIFPYDDGMGRYLRASQRDDLAALADGHAHLLRADPEIEADPERFFEQVIDIDLSTLEPHIVGPHTPDLARPVSRMAQDVTENDYPDRVSVALIGSCTNSSYEDISRATDIAEQAIAKGAKVQTPLMVTPGSEQIRATIERDGQMRSLEAIGATVLANACGPCVGQWGRSDVRPGEQNSIVTSFNRNFPRRNDGSQSTLAFIGSPETVVAYALSGKLSFNPLEDTLPAGDGGVFKLTPPKSVPDVPEQGFVRDEAGYLPPAVDGDEVEIVIDPASQRIARLEPFPAWDGQDFTELPVLFKASGKCTTDHISPAGPWLALRGHLDKLSDNLFLGLVNAFAEEPGKGANQVTGARDESLMAIARDYKSRGLRWVMVGDWNYGEGSSREHAAMSPRHLGAVAVIARSFARIHETNLKKQGLLPLTFADPADYDRVQEADRVSITGLASLRPGAPLRVVLHHGGGAEETIEASHSLSVEQIAWFRAGSALNALVERPGGAA